MYTLVGTTLAISNGREEASPTMWAWSDSPGHRDGRGSMRGNLVEGETVKLVALSFRAISGSGEFEAVVRLMRMEGEVGSAARLRAARRSRD
jgi:hypothetical protein